MGILSFNMRSEMLKLRPFEILATYNGAIWSSGMKLSGELTAFNALLVSIRHDHMTSLRVSYCVADASYGLGRPLGDCRPALLKVQKYQMVKTQTEPQ